MQKSLPIAIRLWFASDLVLALLPPVHWEASGATPLLGVPRVLAYLVGSSIFIAASVVAAYRFDPALPNARTRPHERAR